MNDSRMRMKGSRRTGSRRGFALVITVSLMVLLVLLAVGLLSLSAVALRTGTLVEAEATARANARLALMIAVGELQKAAGPDRRITAPAGITAADSAGGGLPHRHWTGVWTTRGDETLPAWLVSGNESMDDLETLTSYPGGYHRPDEVLDEEDSALVHTGIDSGADVRAPTVETGGGRYAWWISDEGAKVRIDVGDDAGDERRTAERVRDARGRVPGSLALGRVGERFAAFRADGGEAPERRMLVSTASLGLALDDDEVARRHFHDLTAGGSGLPVNVVDGGLKNDLSIVFDSSQRGSNHIESVIGASPRSKNLDGEPTYDFDVADPGTFYFSDAHTRGGRRSVGPNWGILYNYANLWESAEDGEVNLVRLDPDTRTDLRRNDWSPYANIDEGEFRRDLQHTNSGVYPVVSMLQIGFRISAKRLGVVNREVQYQMQLQMKPLVGLWNPYNVRISEQRYHFAWALYPYLRLGIKPPRSRQITPEIWMREEWLAGSSSNRAVENGLDKWFDLRTEEISLEPGEMRLFSVATETDLGRTNDLVSTWNERGAFTFNLRHPDDASSELAGKPIVVPERSVAWFGDLFIEDYQHPSTERKFGNIYDSDGVSASWFAMRGRNGDAHSHRVSDIWQTATSSERDKVPFAVPEQVISEWVRTGTTAEQIPVEQLAVTPSHIGTWRWMSRTTSGAPPRETARGWIDTNPRFAASNPRWDGSRVSGRGGDYQGWFFISPLIGASYDGTYDGGPPGRGKIAEGQNEVSAFPEAAVIGDRYQGYTGLSNNTSGQTHATIYDVPRAPLVSVGQFQHAQLSRYGFEPGFALGNSYANPRIPLDRTYVDDFNGIRNFRMIDISHEVNEILWDSHFFSTIGRDYYGAARGGLDHNLPFDEFARGERRLANSRHRLRPQPGDESFKGIIDDAGEDAARAMSARIMVEGAFNVNSTSVEAWKAVLASLEDLELPVLSGDGESVSWENPEGVRFPRFGHVLTPEGWQRGDGPLSPAYWRGFRTLEDDEFERLAEEVVVEIRERGPFRSFADFVNRDPDAEDEAHRRKGALQAALDRAVNDPVAGAVGDVAENPEGALFSDAVAGESTAAGHAGYVLQGDVLQHLAPVMQARSDYFRVRAVGEVTDSRGGVIARAVCEAYVQRVPEYIDPADKPEVMADDLGSEINSRFGRSFEIVSFRWLTCEEI